MHGWVPLLLLAGFDLAGGVKTSCVENLRGRVGRARVEIVVAAGALQEEEGERGVAHLLEHLLLRPLNLDDSNGATSWDYTTYYRDVSGGELETAAATLIAAVRSSTTFDAEAFQLEQKIVVRELEVRGIANAPEWDSVFGGTILARAPGASAQNVRELELQDAKRFHQRYYNKSNMAVILEGAPNCEQILQVLTPQLAAIPGGPRAQRAKVSDREPGARALANAGGFHFRQGFYWYHATPEEEVVLRLLVTYLGQKAMEDLRKQRGIAYSPSGTFSRRGPGGTIQLDVKTDGESSQVDDWYQSELGTLRQHPKLTGFMATALPKTRKAVHADSTRNALAAIYDEPEPVTLLDKLTDEQLSSSLRKLTDHRRAFGTSTPESNVLSLVILALFGVAVLGAFWLVYRQFVG